MPNPDPSSTPMHRIRIHTPADLVEALPYTTGYLPEQSLVIIAIHASQFSMTLRVDLPRDPAAWSGLAADATRGLLKGLANRGLPHPEDIIAYLLSDPVDGLDGHLVATELIPLIGLLQAAFTSADIDADTVWLCISDGRWWLLTDGCRLDRQGTPMPDPAAPGAVTAAFTFAGERTTRTQADITASFAALTGPDATAITTALEDAARPGDAHALTDPAAFRARLESAATAFAAPDTATLPPEETARLLLALYDPDNRDWALGLADTHTRPAALKLFTYLASASVPPFEILACAPLTLLGFTAWCDQDQATARLALHHASETDPQWRMADLMLTALNSGMTADGLIDIVREFRSGA